MKQLISLNAFSTDSPVTASHVVPPTKTWQRVAYQVSKPAPTTSPTWTPRIPVNQNHSSPTPTVQPLPDSTLVSPMDATQDATAASDTTPSVITGPPPTNNAAPTDGPSCQAQCGPDKGASWGLDENGNFTCQCIDTPMMSDTTGGIVDPVVAAAQAQCAQAGGTWDGNAQACAVPGMSQADCTSQGGVYDAGTGLCTYSATQPNVVQGDAAAVAACMAKGWMWSAGNCIDPSGAGRTSLPDDVSCGMQHGTWDYANNVCVMPPAAPPPSWWSGLSSAEKYGIIGAGAAVVGLGAYFVLKPKRATPNRRRRAKARR